MTTPSPLSQATQGSRPTVQTSRPGSTASPLPPSQAFAPDEVLAERYRIVRFLARGGMGEVYEAEDTELRQRVALKTISSNRTDVDALATERFKREIALARTVTHPNVCRIFDLGQHQPEAIGALPTQSVTFLTMELLAGETLSARLKRGRLAPDEAVPLVTQMAAGLDAAHRVSVVHRDFKCENVFLVPTGAGIRVVVTDFGVARGVSGDQFASLVTGDAIVGTPAYMAPEQVEGGEVGPATDVYALGVVLYEIATGRLPFTGDNPITAAVRRLKETPTAPRLINPHLPPIWEQVILRCLEREPGRRFASASAAAEALESGLLPGPSSLSQAASTIQVTGTPTWPAGAPATTTAPTAAPTAAPATEGNPLATAGTSSNALASQATVLTPPPTLASQTTPLPLTGPPAPPSGTEQSSIVLAPGPPAEARRVRRLLALLAAVAVISAGLYVFNLLTDDDTRITPRRSVAVMALRNLTGSPESAWLSTALAEMLTTELARGETLRTIRGEKVAAVQQELQIAPGDPLSETQISKARTLLGTDFLISGSFAQVAGGDEIRLDLQLIDAAVGSTLASVSESGGEADLFGMIGSLGDGLRQTLGVGEDGSGDDPLAGLPQSREAARLYSEALDHLRGSEPQLARELLQKATGVEAQNPLIHSALSAAWSAQGYTKRATEAAERAFELSSGLPREDRLMVEGRYREAQGDLSAAAQIYASLREYFPDDLEYGLRLVSVANAARQPRLALETIDELKLLPAPISDDPRIDLAEASAAGLLGEYEQQLAAAIRAEERSAGQGSSLQLAEAKLAGSQAYRFLGRIEEAEQAATEARDLFEQAGSPSGVALARTTLANALVDQGELDEAAETYRSAVADYRSMGDQGGAAAGLNNLALALRRKGELDSAQTLYEEAQAIYVKTDNHLGLANSLNNQGVLLVSRDQPAAALEKFQESQQIWEEMEDPSAMAYSFNNIAAVLRMTGELAESQRLNEKALEIRRDTGQRLAEVASLTNLGGVFTDVGELGEAERHLDQAVPLAAEVGDRAAHADALFAVGELRHAQGNLDEALAAHRQALELREALKAPRRMTESRLALARLSLSRGEGKEVVELARAVIEASRAEQRPSEEALAHACLARLYARQQLVSEAERAMADALALAEHSERPAVKLEVSITAAELRAGNDPEAAREDLQRLAANANALGYAELGLEAGLAWAEVVAEGGGDAWLERLRRLREQAEAKGYTSLADRAARLLSATA